MTELTQILRQQAPVTPEQVATDLRQLTHSLPSLQTSQQARDHAEAILPTLKRPADPTWLMARIASLLAPYFEKNTPPAIRQMEAEDWAVALGEYPQHAVQAAVRWWKSADNPKRNKRPLEGDIEERCKIEMAPVRAAEIYLSMPVSIAPQDCPEPRKPLTAAQKAEAARMVEEFARRARVCR